jgi:hypothetical protein
MDDFDNFDGEPQEVVPVKTDAAAIVAALGAILKPGQVTELRALEAVTGGSWRPNTVSGYFDNWEELAAAAAAIHSAKGIYLYRTPSSRRSFPARAIGPVQFSRNRRAPTTTLNGGSICWLIWTPCAPRVFRPPTLNTTRRSNWPAMSSKN